MRIFSQFICFFAPFILVTSAAAATDLDLRFLRGGSPYPVVVTIHDGTRAEVHRDRRELRVHVDDDPTIMIQYALENGEVSKEVIPRLPLKGRDALKLDIHLLGSDEMRVAKPVLLAHERGVDIRTRSDIRRDGPRTFVTTEVSGPVGTLYVLDTKLGTPQPPTGVSCEACRGIPNVDHVRSLSGESTPTASIIETLATPTNRSEMQYQDLVPGTGGLTLAGVVSNGRTLGSVTARLDGKAPRPDAVPDFLAKTGRATLRLRIAARGDDTGSRLDIPVKIDDRQNRHVMIDVTDIAALSPFQAVPIGDVELGSKATGFALAVLGVTPRRDGALVDVAAESPGWIALALPAESRVTQLIVREMDSFGPRKDSDLAYAISEMSGNKILVGRVPEGFSTLDVRLAKADAPGKKPEIIARINRAIDDLTTGPDGPKPFECTAPDLQTQSACLAVCGFAQNLGCSCSSIVDGCACECPDD